MIKIAPISCKNASFSSNIKNANKIPYTGSMQLMRETELMGRYFKELINKV